MIKNKNIKLLRKNNINKYEMMDIKIKRVMKVSPMKISSYMLNIDTYEEHKNFEKINANALNKHDTDVGVFLLMWSMEAITN